MVVEGLMPTFKLIGLLKSGLSLSGKVGVLQICLPDGISMGSGWGIMQEASKKPSN